MAEILPLLASSLAALLSAAAALYSFIALRTAKKNVGESYFAFRQALQRTSKIDIQPTKESLSSIRMEFAEVLDGATKAISKVVGNKVSGAIKVFYQEPDGSITSRIFVRDRASAAQFELTDKTKRRNQAFGSLEDIIGLQLEEAEYKIIDSKENNGAAPKTASSNSEHLYRSLLLSPILTNDGTMLGVLEFVSVKKGVFTDEIGNIASSFAALLSDVLHNTLIVATHVSDAEQLGSGLID